MAVIPSSENNALLEAPWITQYWDYEKNILGPESYTRQSGRKIWFKCQNCHQSTQRTVASIVKAPHSCAVCSGKIVIPGVNDLQSQRPEIAAEWSHKNQRSSSEVLASGGQQRRVWECSRGHEWEASIGSRTGLGNGCPYCANQKVVAGENDLATTMPELLSTWNWERNSILPTQITRSSNKPVWWKCEKRHEWQAAPNSRWSYRYGVFNCNRCSRASRTSTGEKELLEYCQSINPNTVGTFPYCKGVELDVYMEDLCLAIEFNGDYWHSDKVMKEKYGLNSYSFHSERKNKLEGFGVKLYFVWEQDWKTSQKKVKETIKRLVLHNEESPILLKLTNSKDEILQPKVKKEKKRFQGYLKCDERVAEIEEWSKDYTITYKEAAGRLGVSTNCIKRWVKEQRIEWSSFRGRSLSPGEVEELRLILQTEGKSAAARRFGCSRILVQRWMKEYGL